jgi:alpha-beta hydrolase superfamily lysophospholipase
VELELGFEAIALPVLFVHGGNDPIVPVSDARSWSARIPDGRITEFPGAHHDVLNETVHREVAAVVADFVISVAEVADPANTLAIAR